MGFIGKWFACAGLAVAGLAAVLVPGAQASFPGQNGKIAFNASGGIHTINADGTGQTLVVPEGVWPAWSADGRRLAYFVHRPDPRYGLNVANADGSGEATIKAGTFTSTQTSSREDFFEEPAWSPDGGTIAYEAIKVSCGHPTCIWSVEGIRAIAPDGSGDHLLVGYPAGEPAYSPDGSRIAWDDDTAQAFPRHVHVSNADGTGDTIPTADENGFDPSWSPDGTRIAFASYVDCCNAEIFVMNADGSDKMQLTFDSARDDDPAWSPDGTKIAWNRDVGLWVMNANGDQQALLTRGHTPDWQPLVGPVRDDYKNAKGFCHVERKYLGKDAFRQKYGNKKGCRRANR